MDLGPVSDLVHRIGEEIVRGADFAARPWHTIIVVADLDVRRRLFGYCFWDDDWEAATPDGFGALLLFVELRDAMAATGPWKKALCRISRPDTARTDATVEVGFDRTGERWVPNPADAEGFARGLAAPGNVVPPDAVSTVVAAPRPG